MKKSVRHWPRLKLFSWCGPAGHHCHLCGSVGHQRGSFQRPCPRRQLAEGSCLLLQDRSGSGCGRHSRRSYTVNCWIQWLIYHNTDTNMASFNHRWFNLSTSSLSLRCFFFFFSQASQQSLPPVWHWAQGGWPGRTPSFAASRQWRRWDALLSSAPTKQEHWPPTRCQCAGWDDELRSA